MNKLKIGVNAHEYFGINAALPHYSGYDDNDYLRLRYTGVHRALGTPKFTAFGVRVVSADLQRFIARQDLAKLSLSIEYFRYFGDVILFSEAKKIY